MLQPLVSVICTCFNHEKYVVKTLDSVYNQIYPFVQIIIIDDCSTDNSVIKINQWIQNKKEVIFIVNDKNIGITKSFNKAAKYAKGDFLLDLSCDDILFPHSVKKQVSAFLKCDLTQTVLIFSNAELIDQNNHFLGYYFDVNQHKKAIHQIPTQDLYTYILQGEKNCICSVSALINKRIFDRLQGYDENLFFEDLDFWIRASRSYRIVYFDDFWVQKRILKDSLSFMFNRNKKHTAALHGTMYKIFEKVYDLNQNKEEDNAIVKRINTTLMNNLKMGRFLFVYKLLKLKVQFKKRKF